MQCSTTAHTPAQGFEPAGFAIWSQRANHYPTRALSPRVECPMPGRKHLLIALSDSSVCQCTQVARRCRRRRAASARGRPLPATGRGRRANP
eukprot:6524961-Prymnesium_polylepis.1